MSKDQKPKLKIVVRNLPPNLTEDQFKQTLDNLGYPINNGNAVEFFYYVPGKITYVMNSFVTKPEKPKKKTPKHLFLLPILIFYLHLQINFMDMFLFLLKVRIFQTRILHIDPSLFWLISGTEQRAQVEYSPFQKVPKQTKKKVDARENTISSGKDFVSIFSHQILTTWISSKN